MSLFSAKLSERKALDYALKDRDIKNRRSAYFQVTSGSIEINQRVLNAGNAAMFDSTQTIKITAMDNAEILLFDLPAV